MMQVIQKLPVKEAPKYFLIPLMDALSFPPPTYKADFMFPAVSVKKVHNPLQVFGTGFPLNTKGLYILVAQQSDRLIIRYQTFQA